MTKPLCVVFSGAGISAESGIPTFRDSNGLWENHRVEDVADPRGWKKDPELVLKFYEARINSILKAEPNDAHKAVASLEEKYRVINYTQNIDDLLERAGCSDVRHMHGSVFLARCSENCGFQGLEIFEAIKMGDLCPRCQAQLRPDVVWFGEAVQFAMHEVKKLCFEAKHYNGVFIVVGTSGEVQPAAHLIALFSQVGKKYIVDQNPRRIGNYKLMKGLATEQMVKLSKILLGRKEPSVRILSRSDLLTLVKSEPNVHNAIVIHGTNNYGAVAEIVDNCKDVLTLEMNDVTSGSGAPTKEQVESAINAGHKVIACKLGVSRSSAIAFLIQWKADPEAAMNLLDFKKHFPNELILKHGMEILGDQMKPYLTDFYKKVAKHKGWRLESVTKYFRE